MVVVWLVESFQQGQLQLSAMISGIVPVRSFGSMSSLVRVVTMESGVIGASPLFVVVDGRSIAHRSDFLTEVCQSHESCRRQLGVDISFLVVCDSLAPAELPHFVDVLKPSMLVTRVLEAKNSSERLLSNSGALVLAHGDARFEAESRTLRCRGCGSSTSLTIIEAKILKVLIKNPEQIIERSTLIREVWGELTLSPRNIDAHMSRLRNRISFAGLLIEAEYGQGYKLSINPSSKDGCEAASGRMSAPRGVSIRVDRPASPAKQR